MPSPVMSCAPASRRASLKTASAAFTVTIVDAAASADGRVVGTCERGSKKIVYLQQPDGAGAAPATAPARRGDAILTECRDGTVSVGGNCRK